MKKIFNVCDDNITLIGEIIVKWNHIIHCLADNPAIPVQTPPV